MIEYFYLSDFLALLERVDAFSTITNDPILATIYAGLCMGIGAGLVLESVVVLGNGYSTNDH
ncbi:YitT family protein [Coprobacillaceae bacterium CR2/5/TPMF4]|nr:YitT family protein [Coprobacillaceae bacterium CR2/5/TPMF4]